MGPGQDRQRIGFEWQDPSYENKVNYVFVSKFIWLFSVCELSLIVFNQKSSHHLFFQTPIKSNRI